MRHDLVKDVLAEMCKSARLSCEAPDLLIRYSWKGHGTAYDLMIYI